MSRLYTTIKIATLTVFGAMPVLLQAQNGKRDLGVKEVNVVKSYTPTIADAYKKKEDANLKDSLTLAKKQINYSIYSVPVASTFVPEKGKAATVLKNRKSVYNNSYAALGFGNYTTLYADASLSIPTTKESTFSVLFNHLSSAANVENVVPKSNFAQTQATLGYDFLNSDFNFGIQLNGGRRLHNWYGVKKGVYTDAELSALNNTAQAYIDYGARGYFNSHKSFFKGVEFAFVGLTDDYKTSETHLIIKPAFEFDLTEKEQAFRLNAFFDYLNGKFNQSYSSNEVVKNNWMLFGLNPTYHYTNADLTLKAGIGFAYASSNTQESEHGLYPDVEVSYRLLDDYIIGSASARGMMQQNSFSTFTKENPFVSPTLTLAPTDVNFDFSVGLKGKIDSNLSYQLQGGYKRYENLPMFVTQYQPSVSNFGYQHYNAFNVIYDQVDEAFFTVELGGNFERIAFFTLKGKVNTHTPKNQPEAWNLPHNQWSLYTDFKVTDELFVGTDIFFIGKRKDLDYPIFGATNPSAVTLKSYIDLNLHADYTLKNSWTIFAKINNILSDNYQHWHYYPVQGIQFLGGIKYQFKL
ncbi:TonB-dependent receptor [Capnocytophaga canimorsus]|uniref:TonB-dependent receptor n=1 Tax=Capnocytophaga canimorsus TaxID=28188 RepID=UPI0037D7F900